MSVGDKNPSLNLQNDSHSYSSYLKLPRLLSAMEMLTDVHDEHLFITTHQAHEIWFRQILFEIDSLRGLLSARIFDESKMLVFCRRVNRIILIMKSLMDQMMVLETMTPMDFMAFRDALGASSGFQSLQFRILENKLGVLDKNRIFFNKRPYQEVFVNDKEALEQIEKSLTEPSLFVLINDWLERTPGLESDSTFWEGYKIAARQWIIEEFKIPAENETDIKEKEEKMAKYLKQHQIYETVLEEENYNASRNRGERRLTFRAFQGALLVSIYSEMPRFHQPFVVLSDLMTIDSQFTKWRHTHVSMVQRMIGSKAGTGGSSGYNYLRSTISDRYKIFVDFFNLPTYIIPQGRIPQLDKKTSQLLGLALGATVGTAAQEP